MHPLAVSADWTAFGAEALRGQQRQRSAHPHGLQRQGCRRLHQMVQGREKGLAANDGAATLSLTGLKAADSGTYTYKVSNGVCTNQRQVSPTRASSP